ncbi:MAG: hypothetical protein ACRC92_20535 [Peptostreptococcaceae bacterium]
MINQAEIKKATEVIKYILSYARSLNLPTGPTDPLGQDKIAIKNTFDVLQRKFAMGEFSIESETNEFNVLIMMAAKAMIRDLEIACNEGRVDSFDNLIDQAGTGIISNAELSVVPNTTGSSLAHNIIAGTNQIPGTVIGYPQGINPNQFIGNQHAIPGTIINPMQPLGNMPISVSNGVSKHRKSKNGTTLQNPQLGNPLPTTETVLGAKSTGDRSIDMFLDQLFQYGKEDLKPGVSIGVFSSIYSKFTSNYSGAIPELNTAKIFTKFKERFF